MGISINEKYIQDILEQFLPQTSTASIRKDILEYPAMKNFYDSSWNDFTYLKQWDCVLMPFPKKIKTEDNGKFLFEEWLLKAMIISNTCDISQDNQRDYYVPYITYCPIVSMKRHYDTLALDGLSIEQIEWHLDNIRKWKITCIFYLPARKDIDESFVFLDRIYSKPYNYRPLEDLLKDKISSLSESWYYILLSKLVLHFTRADFQS